MIEAKPRELLRARSGRTPDTAKIKKLLIDVGVNQAGLAKKLDVAPQYLNELIQGRRRISLGNPAVHHIADFLGESVDLLFPSFGVESQVSATPPAP